MKMVITLLPEEVKIAISEYLQKQGFSKINNIKLNADKDYDYYDKPIGVVFTNATVDVEYS
jgi:hypothetical protein